MYYHPSMFDDPDRRRPQPQDALIELLLESIHRLQTVQVGALEVVARLGEMAADTQRQLLDLLAQHDERHGDAPGKQEGSRPEREKVRSGPRAGRMQMIA
jgi:hypothetical protein